MNEKWWCDDPSDHASSVREITVYHMTFPWIIRYSRIVISSEVEKSFLQCVKETLIKSLPDFTLEFLCMARNKLTRIASYLRKVMAKLCIKILVKSDSAI